MNQSKRGEWFEILSKASLFLFWASFFFVHLYSFFELHKLSLLLFAISESIVATLFLIRKKTDQITRNPVDYFVTFLGTFLIFLYRPTNSSASYLSELILVIGLLLLIYSTISLGRSFGLVPANRGVKIDGAYKYIRHPIYLSYFILYIGYISDNFSLWNIILFIFISTFQITRMYLEERILDQDFGYIEYKKHVKYRIIPGVF